MWRVDRQPLGHRDLHIHLNGAHSGLFKALLKHSWGSVGSPGQGVRLGALRLLQLFLFCARALLVAESFLES
jgi:hypothetical protein